jgi:hypothetical protein
MLVFSGPQKFKEESQMTFDPVSIVNMLVSVLQGVPAAGPVLLKIAAVAVIAVAASTSVVAVMHALIALFVAVSNVPGCSKLQALASKLQVYDQEGEDALNKYILPILNRFSLLAPPAAPKA